MVTERNAFKAMSRLLSSPPPLAPNALLCGTQLTRRWMRDGFSGYAPGMTGCLIGTYYGRPQHCAWTMEGRHLSGRLRPGTVTVIADGHDGRWELAGPVLVSHVYLSNERLLNCAGLLTDSKCPEILDRVGFDDAVAASILSVLSDDETRNDHGAQLLVDRAVDLLWLQLLRRQVVATTPVAPATGRGLAPWQLKRVAEYMIEHLDRPIGLEELATQARLSRYYFCTAFRLATGRTPHAWLTEQRMLRARRLLTDTTLSINDIAYAVGYATQSAFTTTFRRIVGVTPSRYRQYR